jgi:phospholipid/cholesterol/gamma-HCH transport system substrate-binding protein
MKYRIFEFFLGVCVLFVFFGFVKLVYSVYSTNSGVSHGTYTLKAAFNNIDGISVGSPVKIGGFKIGTVEDVKLENVTYKIIVTMKVKNQYQFPVDSSASVQTAGLLGEKYIGISPGGDEEFLKNNSKISFTQDSVNIESLVSKFAVGK